MEKIAGKPAHVENETELVTERERAVLGAIDEALDECAGRALDDHDDRIITTMTIAAKVLAALRGAS